MNTKTRTAQRKQAKRRQILQHPLNKKAVAKRRNHLGYISGVVTVELKELLNQTREERDALIEKRLVGRSASLTNIDLQVVGGQGQKINLHVYAHAEIEHCNNQTHP